MNATSRFTKSISLIIVTAALLALFAAPAQPALAQTGGTCIVTSAHDDGRGGTLREMLADTTCETITFRGNYTIVLDMALGPLAVDRSVTIDGAGHTVTLSGGGSVRVLEVGGSSVTFNLQNLSVVDGYAEASDALYGMGGGMAILGATANISHVTFSGNQSHGDASASFPVGGGAIASFGSTLTLTDVDLTGNTADLGGGGIESWMSTVTLARVNLLNNTAGYGSAGMASLGDASLTLTDVTFSGNSATGSYVTGAQLPPVGGGLLIAPLVEPGPATLTNVSFSGNTAPWGGGLAAWGMPYPISVMLTNVTFNGNTALGIEMDSAQLPGLGGGMVFFGGAGRGATLTNVIFSNNSALAAGDQPGLGGGMFFMGGADSDSTLTNATFSNNSAGNGGAIAGSCPNSNCSFAIQNSILWGDGGDEIMGGGLTVLFSDVQGGWEGDGNIDSDPLFVDAAHGNLHLTPGSPAVNNGYQPLLPADALDLDGDGNVTEPIPYDLDGNPRVVGGWMDVGGWVDMGAYELQGLPAVTIQPQSQTVWAGDSVSFSAAASGDTVPTLQWQVSTDGGSSWSDISGANTSPLTFNATRDQDGYQYRAVFTNSVGSLKSRKATLTVKTAPVLTDLELSAAEDTLVLFTAETFTAHFGDADGDSLAAVKIVSLPGNGALSLSGAAVTAGQEIPAGSLGGLVFTPAANWNGTTSFAWNTSDGTVYAAADANAALTITPVNDPPSFTPGGGVTVLEDAPPYNAVWATAVSAGPADESGQALTFQVSNDAPALFSSQPAIAADGKLSFTLAPNANGVATVSVSLKDNGGTADGGSDTSSTVTFQINVTPVPDVQTGPSFTVNSKAGTTDHSCTDMDCTLREAVEAANQDGVASTIELDGGATYTLNVVDNTGTAGNGLPQITTPITINGHGAIIERASAAPNFRFFQITSSGSLTLNEIELSHGTLASNLATEGGAIYNAGTLVVKNSYMAKNEANAGGVISNKGMASIYNSTLAGNYSAFGAIDNTGSLDLYSNTFYDNVGTTYAALSSVWSTGKTWNFNNNLLLSVSATKPLCALSGINPTYVKMAANLATDSSCTFTTTTVAAVKIDALGDNGGLTPNLSIQSGSSAIDVGNSTACKNANVYPRDQRGYNRFADGNGDKVAACDVGAYEYNSTVLPPAPAPDSDAPRVRIVLAPAGPDGANAWYKSPVTVTLQARDASEVIDLRCALDPAAVPASFNELPEDICPFLAGAPVGADGVHTFYAAAMDIYDNKSEVVSAGFKVDATLPVITCPDPGPILLNSGEHIVGPAGVDASVSGLDEAAANILSGSITTDAIGPRSLTFTAFDLAGNLASQECTYNVIYDFHGFYPPVAPAPAINPAAVGSAVPVKFSLAGDQGLDILAAGYPTVQKIDCKTLELVGTPSATKPAGKSGLSYDPLTSWYNYVWKTDKSWAGACRALTIQLSDGTQHVAYFRFQ